VFVIVSFHTADSKSVKQEVNGTVILPPLIFPGSTLRLGSEVTGNDKHSNLVRYFTNYKKVYSTGPWDRHYKTFLT
jgi:hypothetical protein